MTRSRTMRVLAVMMVVGMLAVPVAMAAADSYSFDQEQSVNPYVHEDVLTIAEHDRAEMEDPLEVFDDQGDVVMLDAALNDTQDEPVGVRFDKVEADEFRLFPRVDGEDENSDTWFNHSNWTTTTGISVSDADSGGVDAVNIATNGSFTSSDTATATFETNLNITSDVSKRVMQLVLNVNTLDAGANVTVRAVDADGDYFSAEIDPDMDATQNDTTITNATNNGVVFQERLSELNESGTVDEIQKIEVVAVDADADITITGMDVGSKTIVDLGTTMEDDDGDGEEDDEVTKTDLPDGGVLKLTSLDTMGDWADNAVIHDLEVFNVRWYVSDISDSEEVSTEWSDADDYPSYDKQMTMYADLEVPTYIDLSHGTLELRDNQSLVEERYVTVEVAEDIDSETDFGNVSDGDYSEQTSLYGEKDNERTLDGSVTAGDTYRLKFKFLHTTSEFDSLSMTSSGASTGPMNDGGGSGGLLSMIFTLPGAIITAATGFFTRRWWLKVIPFVGS